MGGGGVKKCHVFFVFYAICNILREKQIYGGGGGQKSNWN